MANEVPKNTWRVRPYGEKAGDYQTVSEWLTGRGQAQLAETTLPPHGIVVERDGLPIAASWLYLVYGIGFAFWEGMITCRGLTPREAREACGHCVGALKAIARENNTGLIKAYVKRSLLRDAMSNGFTLLTGGTTDAAESLTGWIPIATRTES